LLCCLLAGKAHWEVLLRARAIECQCFVIAAAQAGVHNEKRESYGHALIIDPWGEVIGRLEDPQETGECLSQLSPTWQIQPAFFNLRACCISFVMPLQV
jgi:predicted amidohydrolase